MKPIAVALAVLAATCLRAEIKTEEKSQMQFPGMLGRMMGVFGGKAMREGVVDTVAVKGNRKFTTNDTTGRLVDLDEEKVYDLDMKAKTYTVKTFDDLRREMEQAQERARTAPQKPEASGPSEPRKDAKQMTVDFDLKETGQRRNIDGFDCREVVMTITVREKDRTLEQAGGMVMTTHEWLGPKIDGMKEIADFDRRYAEKLRGPSLAAMPAMPSAEDMAAAYQAYPMLKDAIGKFNVERVNTDGTAILTVMTTESVASQEELDRQQRDTRKSEPAAEPAPTSVGGLLGGLGRRAMRSKTQSQQQPDNSTPGRATVMTMNHEVVRVASDVSAADVSIPAGYKQKK